MPSCRAALHARAIQCRAVPCKALPCHASMLPCCRATTCQELPALCIAVHCSAVHAAVVMPCRCCTWQAINRHAVLPYDHITAQQQHSAVLVLACWHAFMLIYYFHYAVKTQGKLPCLVFSWHNSRPVSNDHKGNKPCQASAAIVYLCSWNAIYLQSLQALQHPPQYLLPSPPFFLLCSLLYSFSVAVPHSQITTFSPVFSNTVLTSFSRYSSVP